MYQTHTTAEGDTMLICSMSDSHLFNTIRMICRRIQSATAVLNGGQVKDPLIPVFNPRFSREAMHTRAAQQLREAQEILQPYVMEAALRGLKISVIMQQTYGRNGAVPVDASPSLLSLGAGYDGEDYDDIDDCIDKQTAYDFHSECGDR